MNDVDDDILYTPEALKTLYKLEPSIRDVIVEGRDDVRFIENFLGDRGFGEVSYRVFAANERINLSNSKIAELGFERGPKGRILSLVKLVDGWDFAPKGLTCIVDADGPVPGDYPVFDGLLVTDFNSMESYALTERVINKFLTIGLKRDDPTSNEFLERIIPILVEIWIARSFVHNCDIGAKVTVETLKNHSDLNSQELASSLVRTAIGSVGGVSPKGYDIAGGLEDIRTRTATHDRRMLVRGHDIAPVIINQLKLKNHQADHEMIESLLMTCIEGKDLEEQPMFIKLISRVSA